jgi:serine/threonine protein kinase
MGFPSLSDIISAARNRQFIKDPFFEGESIRSLRDGRPEMYGGGFSQVFIIVKNDEKWAFKVWHSEIVNNRDRYSKIASHLQKYNLPYFTEFSYVENGILVVGELLDTLRIKWIDGLNLKDYISYHLEDKRILQKLADDFLEMREELHRCSISHGDLNFQNIIICDGEIKLIDYDSICVPELDGQRDVCRGQYGYQLPSRFSAGFIASIRIDFFSELIIYLSILAVIENDTLWNKYNVQNADYRLLFTPEDFLDWEYSEIRKDLNLLSPKIQRLVKVLENYLTGHINLVPFSNE